ncbi:MAG: DUF2243 domain-containing protein [Chloroflexota bacterium]|nr:DUF2243 domain-containing protein [Chloroflexota bacterium]
MTGTERLERKKWDAARSLLGTGVILGVGLAGMLDEVIFHQVLQWHNFYVHVEESGRILSDGLLHLVSTAFLLAGALRLWSKRRALSALGSAMPLVAVVLMGVGGFNLYDGTVQHKLLNLHQIREGIANPLPYDIAWNLTALIVLLAGVWLWRRERVA